MSSVKIIGRWWWLILLQLSVSFADAPALRDQVSLNGTWQYDGANNITVPHESNNTFDTRTYTRSIQIPSTWTGKTFMVDFMAVNHSCSVYVDNRFVMEHIGAFVPFSANISSFVQPGNTYQLKVNVRGSKVLPTCDALGPVWPIGKCGTETVEGAEAGLYDEIWLRAYGQIAIIDAFIQTSYRQKKLTVEYTLKNYGTTPRTVTVAGTITPAAGGASVKSLQSNAVTVAAGDSAIVKCETPWADANLWDPDHPNLYHLTSRLQEGTTTVDQEVRRFGFREMWIVGNQFYLNGNRVNLYGENIPESENYSATGVTTRAMWPSSIDKMKAANINYSRIHSHPSRSWLPELADEKGFMLEEESALYARSYYNRLNIERVTTNMKDHWIAEWVRAKRNHPSIVMWSAENEMGGSYLFLLTNSEILELQNTISLYDPTRPVSADGDNDVGGMTYNAHYVIFEGTYEGTINTVTMPTIFAKFPTKKPSGCGEFLTSYGANGDINRWWHGTFIRGLRYRGWTDIRPYQMGWTWKGSPSGPQHDNQVRSWAKVAVLDSAYDDLKLDPVKDGMYPSVAEGSVMARRLVVYNDEFSDPFVTVTVEARQNSAAYATASKTIRLALGEHVVVPCTLQAPYTTTTGSTFEMVLRSGKAGVNKFAETRTFRLNDSGINGTPSSTITLAAAQVTDQAAPYITLAPDTLSLKIMRGAPVTRTFTVANQGGGALNSLSTLINYASGANGWLAPQQPIGQGNTQSFQVRIDFSALPAGTYKADLIASAANASNASARCGIMATVFEGRDPDGVSNPSPGLNYNYYEKEFKDGDRLPVLVTLAPAASGICAQPTLDVRKRDIDFALRYTGYLKVTEPGEYTITLAADAGARLWIGSTVLIENGAFHWGASSVAGSIFLKPGLHAVALDYFEDTLYRTLQLDWYGPGIPNLQPIPASAFFHGDAVRTIAPMPMRFSDRPCLSPILRNGRLTLRYSAQAGLPVHIEVIDIAGRNVRAIHIKELARGIGELPLDLPEGQYLVRVRAGKISLLTRVMMVK